MINFKSLNFRNFMSYGNNTTTVNFDFTGITLIRGENHDNEPNGSNGCGKSAIIEAFIFGVFGKSLSDIAKPKLINNINNKDLEIEVIFETNNKCYKIHRGRNHTKLGTFVFLFESEDESFDKIKDITLDSIGNTDRLIEKILRISYELFVRVVVFSASNTSFFKLPIRTGGNISQSGIIEELFNITDLAKDGEILKEDIKNNETQLILVKNKFELLENEQLRHKNQLDSAKQRINKWETQTLDTIKSLEEKLNSINGIDIENEISILEELRTKEEYINQTKIEFDKFGLVVKKLKTNKSKAEKENKHLLNDKCPYCEQEFKDTKIKIKDNNRLITETIEKLIQNEQAHTDTKETIENLISICKELKEKQTVSNIEEILNIKEKFGVITNKIKELKEEVNPFIEPLSELEEIKFESVNNDEINELTTEIEHQKFLYKLLTNKHSFIRKKLIDKNIPFLNYRLQYYLTTLGLPHIVEFTHDLSATITRYGKILDFGNLSAGQQARVNIALSFAFRDIIQVSNGKINICILDEILDVGLDTIGVEFAISMLKSIVREEKCKMFVVSHRSEIDVAFDNNLVVSFSDNFSEIK